MATPTADETRDQALDMITQVQEAGLRLAGSVAESWATVLRSLPGLAPGVADGPATAATAANATALPRTAAEAVDRFYDTGVQVLEAQRSAVHHALGAVAPALRPLTVVTPPAARR
ncbi:hypothetical protein [Actinomycetospora cinnamomea]|uniref:Uncharacterized protein n=1 Tax=Actinomycetospora cinnamomea TaxID=663609 RepID=A0A2U1FBQ6_9PSEU|nr:hypothetical protein [Actinomycetospora cinnamomea]PVZ09625.1 hypothetical protein C8D89_106289 [Actinomycetospora cinnamomea]